MLEFLTKKTRFLGLDIGTTAIKAAELHFSGGRFQLSSYSILTNYGHLERLNDAIQTSSFKISEQSVAGMVSTILKKSKIDVADVVMSVSNFSSYTTVLDFPYVSDKEISQAMPFQAKQHVPIPMSEVVLDHQVVEEQSGRLLILLIAVPKDLINRYIKIAKLCNLKIKAIELEAISMARILMAKDPNPSLILDIGGRITSLVVTDKSSVRMTGTIDIAGGDLTQLLSSGLSVSPMRAEEIKKAYGLKPPPGQESITGLMTTVLDNIKLEAERMIAAYYRKSGRTINQIYVTGGSANLIGLLEYFSTNSNLKFIKGDLFELGLVDYTPSLAPIIKDIGPSLTVACGLAVKGLQ